MSFKELSMNYFSGFSLYNEVGLFEPYLKKSDFSVCGFSLGAIRAFEYALSSQERIDTLQLFSPAFFQNRDEKFKRLQKIGFQKDQRAYEALFLQNAAYPSCIDLQPFLKSDSIEALELLLDYTWEKEKLQTLVKHGVMIEVYLGGKDKIMDAVEALDFFKGMATTYFIKEGGHCLHGES